MAELRICTVPDCGKPTRLALYCEKHYRRWRKYGDPNYLKTAERGEPLAFLRRAADYTGDDCLIWPYANDGGYGRVKVDGRLRLPHRIQCEVENGPPPTPDHDAAHSCGGGARGCINRRHLRWATPAENSADTLIHGTRAIGERCGSAKLTEEKVRRIRALDGKVRTRDLAVEFGVCRHTIRKVITRELWPHV